MNKHPQTPFEIAAQPAEKTAMHYQIRDKIILPIVRELQANGFPVTNCKKNSGARFTFTGINNGRLSRTELLELKIENDGSLKFTRFIPMQKGKAPLEQFTVNPTVTESKEFMSLLRIIAFELSRFYDKKSILSHIIYKNDPLGIFKNIAMKPKPQ